MLFIVLTLLIMVILSVARDYRENGAIADCKSKGGTPVFATRVRTLTDERGDRMTQEYQAFDRCNFGK